MKVDRVKICIACRMWIPIITDNEIAQMKKLIEEIAGLSDIKMKEGKYLQSFRKLMKRFEKLSNVHEKQVNQLATVKSALSDAGSKEKKE